MRSFVALMTCIGCIAWIHSCDKRLLGVQLENDKVADQPQQLPIVVIAPAAVPVYDIPVVSTSVTFAPVVRNKNKGRSRKQVISSLSTTPLRFNLALVRGPYAMYANTAP